MTQTHPIEQRLEFREKLIEILGEPDSETSGSLNLEWNWNRGEQDLDVIAYANGMILLMYASEEGTLVYDDLDISQVIGFAKIFKALTVCEPL